MSGFKELNDYINKTLYYILESDDICKLLAYNTPDALNKDDIEDKSSLVMNNIFPFVYVPPDEDNDEKKCIISVILEDFSNDGSSYFKKGFITINIICHQDLWKVDDGFRPLLIMQSLELKFNKLYNKHNGLGIGGSTFESASHCWFSKDYSGYSVRYKAVSFS